MQFLSIKLSQSGRHLSCLHVIHTSKTSLSFGNKMSDVNMFPVFLVIDDSFYIAAAFVFLLVFIDFCAYGCYDLPSLARQFIVAYW